MIALVPCLVHRFPLFTSDRRTEKASTNNQSLIPPSISHTWTGDLSGRQGLVGLTSLDENAAVFSDEVLTLTGQDSVVNQVLLVVGADDDVLGCAVIEGVEPRRVEAVAGESRVAVEQASPLVPARVITDFTEASSNLVRFQIASAPFDAALPDTAPCTPAIVGDVYRPFDPLACMVVAGRPCVQDAFAAGDLSGKFGFVQALRRSEETFVDQTITLFGPNSLAYRSLLLTKLGELPAACSAFTPAPLATHSTNMNNNNSSSSKGLEAVFAQPNTPATYRGALSLRVPWRGGLADVAVVSSLAVNVPAGATPVTHYLGIAGGNAVEQQQGSVTLCGANATGLLAADSSQWLTSAEPPCSTHTMFGQLACEVVRDLDSHLLPLATHAAPGLEVLILFAIGDGDVAAGDTIAVTDGPVVGTVVGTVAVSAVFSTPSATTAAREAVAADAAFNANDPQAVPLVACRAVLAASPLELAQLPLQRVAFSGGAGGVVVGVDVAAPRLRSVAFVPAVALHTRGLPLGVLADGSTSSEEDHEDGAGVGAAVVVPTEPVDSGAGTEASSVVTCASLAAEGTREACSLLCRGGCSGPAPAECTGGCLGLEFSGECLQSCEQLSNQTFTFGTTCKACHYECGDGGCSGPGADQCTAGCRSAFDPSSARCVAVCPLGTVRGSDGVCAADDRQGRVVRAVFGAGSGAAARGGSGSGQVEGVVEFWQVSGSSDTSISQTGLDAYAAYTWEIRALRPDRAGHGAGACDDAVVGAVFDPADSARSCTQGDPFGCPVGQLSQRHGTMPLEGESVTDVATPLFGQDLISGRALVLINPADSSDRVCAVIGAPLHHHVITARAAFARPLAGEVTLRQPVALDGTAAETLVAVNVRDASADAPLTSSSHDWLISSSSTTTTTTREGVTLLAGCQDDVGVVFDPTQQGVSTRCGPSTSPTSVSGYQQNCAVGDMTSKHGALLFDGVLSLRFQRVDIQLPLLGPPSPVNQTLAVLTEDGASALSCAGVVREAAPVLVANVSSSGVLAGTVTFKPTSAPLAPEAAALITIDLEGLDGTQAEFGIVDSLPEAACGGVAAAGTEPAWFDPFPHTDSDTLPVRLPAL